MTDGLQGLIAVVTGAASGIGLATARRLHSEGARVIGLDLVPGAVDTFATWIRCDVGSAEEVEKTFREVADHVERIDILVNNAGIGAVGDVESAVEDDWVRVFNVNVMGVARVSRAALPLLRKSSHASIVNICSIAATVGLPDRAVYSASKGAIQSMTMAMAADHAREGIRVNCVNPGTADTPWVNRLLDQAADPAAEKARLSARQPIGRLITADEVASAVAYLANPAQASTTGIALAVDGGMNGLRLPA
ncbi:SDR family NAD(P)-dependent oxidoreductase [Microbacterium sulfonylureivorans]|uniref:SDR family NAD(P)-dependent oxidoreductase n=1 Tax=Microbacterium sulfonylureivorans TaxID=2486854 RepID=UPI000FD8CBAB|nr:SDR family oxidoreductase [Microbacterium sulfonylureivorans]